MFYQAQLLCSRSFQTSVVWMEKDKNLVREEIKAGVAQPVSKFPDVPKHKVSFIDKLMLVANRNYKSWGDVPPVVDHHELHLMRGRMRPKVNLAMIGIGICFCLFIIYSGKRDRKMGRSLTDDNLRWHEEKNREYREKMARLQAENNAHPADGK